MKNTVHLIGRVGITPEVKEITGTKVANFSLATSEKYKNKAGEKVEKTEWHNLVLWRGLADVAELYIKKGDLISVDGKISYRSWEKDGEKKYMTEIVVSNLVMLGSNTTQSDKENTTQSSQVNADVDKNDLPF